MGKLPKQPTTIEKLPREVISDILIRLPAKRVAQMRCVSKPWNSLLSQPSFIKSHLHRSIHSNDEILLVIYDRFCFDQNCMSVTGCPSHSPHIEYPNFIKLPSTIKFPPEYYASTVIGHINGLICFVLWDAETLARPDPIIYIWNPSLNALRILPPFTITSLLLLGFLNADYYIRFGYDANTDDYKVVKLIFELRRKEWLQVEVYSMRKGSWSIINDRFPSSVDCFWFAKKSNSMTGNDGCDGHLHWLCKDGDKTNVVVAFDLSTEIFSEISLPDLLAKFDNKDQRMILGDLAGKLCLMLNIENGGIEVWVMNEYGVAESWVKHLELSQFDGNMIPMGFTLTSQFLMQDKDKQLTLYDQSAGKVKSFKAFSCYSFRIVPYVDSLVWIAPAN